MAKYIPKNLQEKKSILTGSTENENSLGGKFVRQFKDSVEYLQNSKVGKTARYVHDSNMEILRWAKDGAGNTAKGVYYTLKDLPKNLKDPDWRHFTWEFHKYDIIPIATMIGFTVAASALTYLAKTRYEEDLARLIGNSTIRQEFIDKGLMPTYNQGDATVNLLNFGRPSPVLNPADYVKPSMNVPVGTSLDRLILHGRPFTAQEASVIEALKNGAFSGTQDYAKIVATDATVAAAYTAGRYAVGKHAEKKLKDKQ